MYNQYNTISAHSEKIIKLFINWFFSIALSLLLLLSSLIIMPFKQNLLDIIINYADSSLNKHIGTTDADEAVYLG